MLTNHGDDSGFRITGRHVLLAMLAFFGIVIAVNVTFVHLALNSWTGLTDHDSYRTGLSWNRTLERDAAQKALGWSTVVETRSVRSETGVGFRLGVTVTVRGRDGRPVPGLVVDGEARHPLVEADDRPIAFAETVPGTYIGATLLPGAGDWELRLSAARADGTAYRIDTIATVR